MTSAIYFIEIPSKNNVETEIKLTCEQIKGIYERACICFAVPSIKITNDLYVVNTSRPK